MQPSYRADVLALAVSRIHRSETLAGLSRTVLDIAPALVDADAFGVYLLDAGHQPVAIEARRASRGFLAEYEALRAVDPCFRAITGPVPFAHTRAVITEREWIRHPLCRLMSSWGLRYSITAPLTVDGELRGTINFARRDRGYFDGESLARAQFLCSEARFVFDRLARSTRLDPQNSGGAGPRALPPRTQAVAVLAARGLSNREMACRLGISENTVRDHLRRAYAQFGVHNRVQLAARLH